MRRRVCCPSWACSSIPWRHSQRKLRNTSILSGDEGSRSPWPTPSIRHMLLPLTPIRWDTWLDKLAGEGDWRELTPSRRHSVKRHQKTFWAPSWGTLSNWTARKVEASGTKPYNEAHTSQQGRKDRWRWFQASPNRNLAEQGKHPPHPTQYHGPLPFFLKETVFETSLQTIWEADHLSSHFPMDFLVLHK